MKKLLTFFLFILLPSLCFSQPMSPGFISLSEEDGSPTCYGYEIVASNATVTDSNDGKCHLSTGGGAGATSLTGLSDVGSADTTIGNILVADGTDFQSVRVPMAVRTDTNRVGIGTTAPNQQLELTANFRLPDSTSTTGNIYKGTSVFVSNIGTDNTFFGKAAGNLTLSGNDNLLVGPEVGTAITTGSENVCVGGNGGSAAQATCGSLTIGTQNTCLGQNACNQQANINSNVCVGQSACSNTNADDMVVIGRSAQSAVSGTPAKAIAIGNGGTTAHASSIAIGYNADTTAANQALIGSADSSGSITDIYLGNGVVKASPSAVTVNASGGSGADNAGANLILSGGKGTGSALGGDILLKTSDAGASSSTLQSLTTKVAIKPSGRVGIGNTAPTTELDVTGTVTASTAVAVNGSGNSYLNAVTGNVGVGLTNPSFLVDIDGIMNAISIYKGGAAMALTGLSDVGSSTKTAGNILIADGTDFESVTVGGDATLSSAGSLQISSGTIGSSELASNGVTSGTFLAANVTVDEDGRITNAVRGSLTSLSNVSSATITAGNILIADGTNFASVDIEGDATITSAGNLQLGSSVVGPTELASNGVSTGTFLAANVTVDEDGRVTNAVRGSLTSLSDVGSATNTSGNILVADGTNFQSVTQASIDHGSLGGLLDDDHTQYLLLAGRSTTTNDPLISTGATGTIYGSDDSAGILSLQSSTNATRGTVDVERKFRYHTATSITDSVGGVYNTGEMPFSLTLSGATPSLRGLVSTGTITYTVNPNAFGTMSFFNMANTIATTGNLTMSAATAFASGAILSPLNTATTTGFSVNNFLANTTMTATTSGTAAAPFWRGLSCTSVLNAGWTVTDWQCARITDPTGSSGTITNMIGFDIAALTGRSSTLIAGIRSAIASGTGKWFLQSTGDAPSSFGGDVFIGSTTPTDAAPKFVVSPPTAETITAEAIITADACGTIKQITAAGAVTTSTANTFTAPASTNSGCIMHIVNTGANNITLDNNANFVSPGAADVVMTGNDSITVGSNGTAWYALTALVAN